MKQSAKVAAVALAFGLVGAAQAQYKCVGPGGVSYQQAPCPASAKAQQMDIRVGPVPIATPRPATLPASAAAPEPVVVIPVPPMPGSSAAETYADRLAAQCMEWYRPRLRDPRSAYLAKPVAEKNMVTMDVHATNGFGGYVVKQARCEFGIGGLDRDWTLIHAVRLGW